MFPDALKLLLWSLLAMVAAVPVLGGAEPGSSTQNLSNRFAASEQFFNAPVTRLKIQIPPADMSALQRENRQYVKARVTEGDRTYTNVGLHLKGAAGSFRSVDQNPSLTLNFDKFSKGQSFHGLDKIHLNNSIQDPSLITYGICAELFRQAGVPAARVTYARVELNGRNLGLYVLVEGYDKTFLRHHFRNAEGNFYDGGFVREIGEGLQKTSGSDPRDQAELKALVAAAREPDVAKRFVRLEKVLDVDRFVSYLAMEILIWDWDGYPLNRNNYRLYHDPSIDRIVFLPHGMDQMFWEAGGSIFPGMQGFVANAFLGTPEGRARYLSRLSELYTRLLRAGTLTRRVDEEEKKIQAALQEFNPGAARNHKAAAADIRNKIVARIQGVGKQIAQLPKPLMFDATGVARLPVWTPKPDRQNAGNTRLDEPQDSEHRNLLRIAAQGEVRTSASWRSRVLLSPGQYRFEGTAKTKGVTGTVDTKGEGAGLRISGTTQPRENRITGTGDWKKLEFDFSVPPSPQDVELICELRATRGEVWFDKSSLKLIRQQGR